MYTHIKKSGKPSEAKGYSFLPVIMWYFLAVEIWIETVDHTWRTFFWLFVLLPVIVYVVCAIGRSLGGTRYIKIARNWETIPRCFVCEADHAKYTIRKVTAKVWEFWDETKYHTVEVDRTPEMKCSNGHQFFFNEFYEGYCAGENDYLRKARMLSTP